jgi:pimeloyl-ACP methyl ester carboxylesterase
MTAIPSLDERVRELGRPGDRVLGVCEYGDPAGLPVLAFHGIPGTRLMFRPTHAIAARHGLRIITPDRPGFGRSRPQPGRELRDWVPEVEAVLDAYAIDRFALIGVSGGAPFATATAARFGNRVSGMILFGPMGPVAELHSHQELSWLERTLFLRLPKVPGGLRALLAPANALFRMSPKLQYDLFLRALPPADRRIMRDPALKAQVIEDVRESLKQHGDGMRSDLRIFSHPWNVDYAAITAPTVLWQGLDDTIVPVAAALLLARFIPGCDLRTIPEAGHFWVYDHIEEVLVTLKELTQGGGVAPA